MFGRRSFHAAARLLCVVAVASMLCGQNVVQGQSVACSFAHPNGGTVDLTNVASATVSGTVVVPSGSLDRSWSINLCAATPPAGQTPCTGKAFVQQYSNSTCERSYTALKSAYTWDATNGAFKAVFVDAASTELYLYVACGSTADLRLSGNVQMFTPANAFNPILSMTVTTAAACAATPAPSVVTTPPPTTTTAPTTAAASTSPATSVGPTPAPPTLAPPTPVPSTPAPPVSNTPINVLVLLNYQWTTMTAADASVVLQRYLDRDINASPRRPLIVRLVDTGGTVLTASVNLLATLNSFSYVPDVVVVADSTDATVTVQNALLASPQTQSVPVISAFASGLDVLDPIARPLTMSVVPSDKQFIRAIFDLTKRAAQWGSMGVVYSQNTYGRDLLSALNDYVATQNNGPVVLTRTPMLPFGDASADDDTVAKLLLYKPVGVLCLVTTEMLPRLRAAVQRNPNAARLFLLVTPTSLSALPSMSGSPAWGAAVAPIYTRVFYWLQRNLVSDASAMDEPAAYLFSNIFDALRVVSNAVQLVDVRGAPLLDAMKSMSFLNSFTGPVTFTAAGERSSASVVLLVASSADKPLATWSAASAVDPAPAVGAEPLIQVAIAQSPLKAIPVCMAAPPSCPAVANLNHALYILLDVNANATLMGDTTIVPIAFNTGFQGVDGLRNLLPLASSCRFLIGPSSSTVNFALTPVINEFRIPQIDFASASSAFSDKRRFPYFTRVAPSDFIRAQALTAAIVYFGWERVLLVTSDDEYGTSVADAYAQVLEGGASLLESTYKLADLTSATVGAALKDIRDVAIGRVVVVMFSGSTMDSYNFFQTVQDLGMNRTHIFILGDVICQHALSFPEMRAALLGSICAAPWVDTISFSALRMGYTSSVKLSQMRDTLAAGGFDTTCPLTFDDPYSAFAFDAATLLVRSLVRIATGTSGAATLDPSKIATYLDSANASFITQQLRATEFFGVTGNMRLDANGDRTTAAFVFNIQQYNNRIVSFGDWNNMRLTPFSAYTLILPLRWLDNSTDVPGASTRSIAFIAIQTAKQHPATIALSILGFGATIAVFFFCYRHYRLQKMLEQQALDGGAPTPADVPPKHAGKEAGDTIELRTKQ